MDAEFFVNGCRNIIFNGCRNILLMDAEIFFFNGCRNILLMDAERKVKNQTCKGRLKPMCEVSYCVRDVSE